jgi:hypothetical protein
VREVSGVPSYTNDPQISITGVTEPQAEVRVTVDDRTLGRVTAQKDGTFGLKVTLPEQGEQTLAVMTDTAEVMLAVTYEMPMAKFVITGPENTTFNGEHIMVRGETEPNATVYITGKGMNTNVKANKSGEFSIRVYIEDESTQTFQLRTKAQGYQENSAEITLTREFTLREGIAYFRRKMQNVEYSALAKSPEKYADKSMMYRGKVMTFADYDGRACTLVCVENPTVGRWYSPIWVVLSSAEELAEGQIATFYVTGEGLTLPADGAYYADGKGAEAPVVLAQYVAEISESK